MAGKAGAPLVAALLALYVFGIGKAALMPLHFWLPAAMVAPTPVSALLHAVAVVKAGVFTVIKVVVYVFGLDSLTETGANDWLIFVASASLLAASFIALSRDNLKARLAYSTVSQLAYVVLGAALATTSSIIGSGMQIAMHAAGKITLFFCAGAIYTAHHLTEVSQMAGIGRKMPVTMLAFLIGSLSIIGLPPLGGSWSKWTLALGALDAGYVIVVGCADAEFAIKRWLSVADRRARVFLTAARCDGRGQCRHRRSADRLLDCTIFHGDSLHRPVRSSRDRSTHCSQASRTQSPHQWPTNPSRTEKPTGWTTRAMWIGWCTASTSSAACWSRSMSSFRSTAPSPSNIVYGFYGIFGFVACVALVLIAKQLRRVLMRPEDYYDR